MKLLQLKQVVSVSKDVNECRRHTTKEMKDSIGNYGNYDKNDETDTQSVTVMALNELHEPVVFNI